MKIDVATQKILLLKDQISSADAEKKAWEKKTSAFDALSKVTGFFSRPQDNDFELTYHEHRYQPFWHVVAHAHYVYNRQVTYQVNVSGGEVARVTLHETEYAQTNGHIHVPVIEHCIQDEQDEVFIDGVNSKLSQSLSEYIKMPFQEVSKKIESHIQKESIVVPPVARVSAIMRDSLAKMIKGIQADDILEEQVEISAIELWYRPIYAFQFKWISKGKEGILEIDGVTGAISSGNRIFREYLGKVLDQNFLFDIGADAAGLLIPGGSIAVKAAKKYIETKK